MASDAFSIAWPISIYYLLAFPFTISVFLMTFKAQNRPRASAFVCKVGAKYSNDLMSVIYILLPCGTLYGGITKNQEVIYKHLFPDFHSAEKCRFFSPSYKSFQSHSITELRQLQTVSSEST